MQLEMKRWEKEVKHALFVHRALHQFNNSLDVFIVFLPSLCSRWRRPTLNRRLNCSLMEYFPFAFAFFFLRFADCPSVVFCFAISFIYLCIPLSSLISLSFLIILSHSEFALCIRTPILKGKLDYCHTSLRDSLRHPVWHSLI